MNRYWILTDDPLIYAESPEEAVERAVRGGMVQVPPEGHSRIVRVVQYDNSHQFSIDPGKPVITHLERNDV